MQIEYEATFTDIDKDKMRRRLEKIGAKLIRPEFMQRRVVLRLPQGHEIPGGWMRVQDEGNRVTLTLKVVDGEKIENQKEILITVDDFKKSVELLVALGCEKKSYQKSKRELWCCGGVEIALDEWPFLHPFVEIEGSCEKDVEAMAARLGLTYSSALFCAVDTLYARQYKTSKEFLDTIPQLTFAMKNPFSSSE